MIYHYYDITLLHISRNICSFVYIILYEFYFLCLELWQSLDKKRGCPVLLKIIFQTIARRLGMRCDLRYQMNLNKYILIWKPKR
jgi:hypothetical protein